jgi:signal transduction histidine kinase
LRPPKTIVVAVSLVLMASIGSLDRVTGRDFALSAFYMIPICWAAWVAGRGTGIVLATVGAVIWCVTELTTGWVYPHPLSPYWSALMLFIFFLVVVCLLSAFQKAHCHLEEMVRRRTSALQAEINERKRLESVNLQAERLAMVGKMAAQVAHDIRNPLGSITLNLDLIHHEIDRFAETGGNSPDEGRALIKEMREEARRIQRVLEDYLRFARQPKLQRQTVDLKTFLADKLSLVSAEFDRAKVRLSTHLDPALATIHADPEQVWQALLNLLRNGREAMPNGGEISIASWRNGGEALLRVSDNGPGMTPEQQQRLYQPFFTTKPQGTGLGLAMVHQIITEHGGRIECESTVSKGATFTISLPIGASEN